MTAHLMLIKEMDSKMMIILKSI